MLLYHSLNEIPSLAQADDTEFAGALTAHALAAAFSEPKYQPESYCIIHGDTTAHVGVMYTDRNVELIITDCCCDMYKGKAEEHLTVLKQGLASFFAKQEADSDGK